MKLYKIQIINRVGNGSIRYDDVGFTDNSNLANILDSYVVEYDPLGECVGDKVFLVNEVTIDSDKIADIINNLTRSRGIYVKRQIIDFRE